MNDLLFYLLLIALAYYFLSPKTSKLTHSQSTQTDPLPETNLELEPTLNELIKDMEELSKKLDK